MVSVIVPIYNKKSTLVNCLESIVNQSYKDIEILLINDGSTDCSKLICDEYAQNDKRIKVVSTENKGAGEARNKGIDMSNGELLFFCDADDVIEHNGLAYLVDIYEDHNVELAIGNAVMIEHGQRQREYLEEDIFLNREGIVSYACEYLKNPNQYGMIAPIWSRLFVARIVKENNLRYVTLRNSQDIVFSFQYLKYVDNLYMSKEVVYNYTVMEESSLSSFQLKEIKEDDYEKFIAYKKVLTYIKSYILDYYVSQKERLEKEKLYVKCIKELDENLNNNFISQLIYLLIRYSMQANRYNFNKVRSVVKRVCNSEEVRESILYYKVVNHNSKTIPFCMRRKLYSSVILLCRRRGNRRYGKHRVT